MERQYVGARYVPVFAEPLEWDNQRSFEALTIVSYLGGSYTSKKAVPSGVLPTNKEYWVQTGNYNAQIEQYRQDLFYLKELAINVLEKGANNTGTSDNSNVFNSLPENAVVYLPKGTYLFTQDVILKNVIILAYECEIILNTTSLQFTGVKMYGSNITEINSITGNKGLVTCSNSNFYDVTFLPINTTRQGATVITGHSTFNNCIFDGGNTVNFGLHCDYDGANLTVRNCEFKNFILNGIFSSALKGIYECCVFSGNHSQIAPSGGGQIDVLSRGNVKSTHKIYNCVFENPPSLGSNCVETYNCIYEVSNCRLSNIGGTFNIVVQGGSKGVIINNEFMQNGRACISVNGESECDVISNIFNVDVPALNVENTETPVNAMFNTQTNSNPLVEYNADILPIGIVTSNDNFVKSLYQGDSIKIRLNNYRNTPLFRVSTNGLYALLALTEFDTIQWIGDDITSLTVSCENKVLTITSNVEQEVRLCISAIA